MYSEQDATEYSTFYSGFSTMSDAEPAMISTLYGEMVVMPEGDTVSDFLRAYGEWGSDETHFVSRYVRDGARVADIGAFVGTFGLGLSRTKDIGSLCAVEPNPATARLLKMNLERNSSFSYDVIEAVVSNGESGFTGKVNEQDNFGSLNFSSVSGPGSDDEGGGELFRSVSLADLRRKFGPFDLIKADVEGMEYEVIASDRDWLGKNDTVIWVECNEDMRALECFEILLELDFSVSYFAFPSHNPHNHNGVDTPIYPWAFEAGLLALPKGTTPVLDEYLRSHGCILRAVRSVDALREALWYTPRWGKREWIGFGAAEAVALAGRYSQYDMFEDYLRTSDTRGDPVPRVVGEADLEEALRHAEGLLRHREREVRELHAELDKARLILEQRTDLLNRTDAALGEAQRLAWDRAKYIEDVLSRK